MQMSYCLVPITVKRQTQNAKLLVVGRARGRISQGAREQGVDLGELFQTHGGGAVMLRQRLFL